jgi:hypothetical protein
MTINNLSTCQANSVGYLIGAMHFRRVDKQVCGLIPGVLQAAFIPELNV